MSTSRRLSLPPMKLILAACALSALPGFFAGSKVLAAGAKDPKADRLWRAKCASCHGEDGKAGTEQGKKMGIRDMTSAAWQKEFSDAQIDQAIQNGLKRNKDGKAQEMEAFKDKVRPDQLPLLVAYVRALAQ